MDGEEEFRFIMIGKSGCGKSTTGNTILGEKKFSTELTFGSTSSGSDLQRVEKAGKRIEILDCPGLYDSSRSEQAISVNIVKAVACMHPGPHAVLFIMRVGRFTAEEFGVYTTLKTLFDEHIVKYIIIIITGGDDLENAGITLTELLKNAPANLLKIMEECNNRCLVFNNNADNTRPQVEDLLKMTRQLVAENNGQPYSCPKYSEIGNDLEKEAVRQNRETKQSIKTVDGRSNAAKQTLQKAELELKLKNESRKRQLEEEQHKFELEKQRLEQELQAMTAASQKEDKQKKGDEQNEGDLRQKQLKEKERKGRTQIEIEKYRLDKERLEFELAKKAEENQLLLETMLEFQRQMKEEQDELRRKDEEWRKVEEERRRLDEEINRKRERSLREEIDRMKDALAKEKDLGLLEWLRKSIIQIFKPAS